MPPRISPNSYFALQTSFVHIFSIVTPNQVILVPKFSKSHPIPLRDIYILLIIAFVWLYAWALGEFILKLSYEHFKMKYTRISRWNIWELRSFHFKAMGQVSLNILHLYNFPAYSVVVVLHACVIECTPMIGLTRIDLSFCETSVIG
jgi:hypothetical protein